MDCVGSYSGPGCRALLASGGRHVIVSGDSIGAAAQVLIPPFTSKPVLARANRERLTHVTRAVAAGRLRVNIEKRFPLAEAEAAHRLSQTGRVTGKLVLIP
jgi:NADPH:quinone reductase-like Zn-dependent oxidoreductase